VNGLAGSSTDTSIVVPIATASVPVVAGSVALVRVTLVAVCSDGHSAYSNVRYLVDGTGPTLSSPSNEGGTGSHETSDDLYAHIEGFNGSGDAVVTIHNDGSGNLTADCHVEIDTIYIKR
jgi:hypothetical protein